MKHTLILTALIVSMPSIVAHAQSLALSPPSWLPGDSAIGQAAGAQTDVDIAAGGGGFLAVWTDSRCEVAGPETDLDVFAMRLDANGTPLDESSFPIAIGPCFQRHPRAAWNGESWLVVYESRTGTSSAQTAGLWGARVSLDGIVLDPSGFPIRADLGGSSQLNWSVCANGSEWVVASQGSAPGMDGIVGTRIDSRGRAAASLERTLVPPSGVVDGDVRLVSAQGELLLAYSNHGQPLARRFAFDLTLIGSDISLPSANVGTNGTSYYVAWMIGGTLRGTPLSLDGVLSFPQGAVIASGQWLADVDRPAWDGTIWWLAFGSYDEGAMVARVAPSGLVIDPNGVDVDVNDAADFFGLRVAGVSSGGALLAWYDVVDYDVHVRRMSASAHAGAVNLASSAAPSQLRSRLCAGAGGFALVFDSLVGAATHTFVQRLDPDGQAIDAQPIELGGGAGPGRPSAAWNGSVYCLVWNEGADVVARRMLPSGQILDTAPIVVMSGFTSDVSASGGAFLIATSETTYGPQYRAIFVRRLDGASGQFLDAAPIAIGSTNNFALYPRTARTPSGWMVVWQMNWTDDSLEADAMLCSIDASGAPGPVHTIASAIGNEPVVAFGSGASLVVYRTNALLRADNDIEARRVLTDGTMLPPFTVSSAPGDQMSPAVTWNGSQFVAAWEDQREQIAFDDACTDVYGARIDANGNVLDPDGFVWRSGPAPIAMPALATYGARTLLATSTFRSEIPFGSYRIEVVRTLGDCASPGRFCHAAINSSGQHARIDTSGTASLSANDLVLTCTGLPQTSFGLFFRGTAPLAWPEPFGAGQRCVGGSIQRLGTLPVVGGSAQQLQDLNGPLWSGVTSGQSAYVQFWYRDSAAGAGVFNASDAIELTFCD